MILTAVRIQNFKSIKDSNEFRIDESVTCLVGKNESGKTATLQAITKLNPTESSDADFDELDYPRHQLSEYQESEEYADALTTKWKLEESDLTELERILGPAARQIEVVEISKGYENKVYYEFSLDEKAVAQHLIETHQLMTDEREACKDATDVAELRNHLEKVEDPTQRQKALRVQFRPDVAKS